MTVMRLNNCHKHILRTIAGEGFLKAHRDLEGNKVFKLHLLSGGDEIIAPSAVAYLVDHGLIDSNKKFPATTYWLTPLGAEISNHASLISNLSTATVPASKIPPPARPRR